MGFNSGFKGLSVCCIFCDLTNTTGMSHLIDKLLHFSSSPHCKKCQADVSDGTSLIACEPGSVVGIATAYGMDGLGIESRWGRDFRHLSRPALGPTQPPVQWVRCLSRGQRATGA